MTTASAVGVADFSSIHFGIKEYNDSHKKLKFTVTCGHTHTHSICKTKERKRSKKTVIHRE